MWWFGQSVHSSWALALAGTLFVVGVFLALWIQLPLWVGLVALPILIALLFVRKVVALPIIGCMAIGTGISYGSAHLIGRSIYEEYIGLTGIIAGRVKEDISVTSSGSKSIQLDHVTINDRALPGSILVTARSAGEALRGDTLVVEGMIRAGFGSFPASVTATRILSVERQGPGDLGRVVRDWFAAKVRSNIPDPQASLGIGFLTGQKSALPTDLSEALKIAGLSHIVVASGYNLTILVRAARKLLLKVSKYLSALFSGLMIAAFLAVTGLSPSMTRAGLVSSMSLLSWYYGHGFHPLVLLPIAAAITVAFQPSYVWGDMGWQLSFVAFAGVMIVAPLLQAYFFGNKEPGTFRQILGETIAAHIVTIPIIAISFGSISNVAVIANLLVVPLVPLAMLLTFICGLLAVMSIPFAFVIAVPTTWLLTYMTQVATFVSELPWAQNQLELAPFVWIVYGAVVSMLCFWMWRKTKYNFRNGEVLY